MRVLCVVLCLGLGVLFPLPSGAEEVRWLGVGLRGGASISGHPFLGDAEDESFQQYDVVGTLGLPWSWYAESDWGLTTQVMGSLGALTGGGGSPRPVHDGPLAVDQPHLELRAPDVDGQRQVPCHAPRRYRTAPGCVA